ncbi:hypothetical protein [Lutibacter sp.]|uniref:hypothetical protein n=1 Tax=Lutibacter sp. TaxID=1925666 RepID=UPI001A32B295|nr:hypothetical protein [Lutibacter sp.]MBI9041874.1 hypothetical protein [Lutibacter sp.]
MKKIILSIVFVFASFAMVNAENIKEIPNPMKLQFQINQLNMIEYINYDLNGIESAKCWAFKIWIKAKLKEVSDDEELINETADSLKQLCEIANDLGWI